MGMCKSRGSDERAQSHSMSYLHSTCDGMSNRELIDDGAALIQQGSEQEQRDRAPGTKALFSMLATTTSGRARELVKQGVAKITDVSQFEWTSSLEDKWMNWVKTMRQVSLTSFGGDARETITIAGLEKAKERALEQRLRLRAPQTWVVLCSCVDQ